MISVVVLTYNNLNETTKPCIESILSNTTEGIYELILVDNASSDNSALFLENVEQQHSHVKVKLNTTNKGYAAGNNDGIEMASGDIVVLLNNDTLVPTGWLEALVKVFDENKKAGLVGPITNSSGNEQCVAIPNLTEQNFKTISSDYAKRQKAIRFNTLRMGFFCVAIKRQVITDIGLLDNGFGIGMFEDDDYCVRAASAGYDLVVAEDCFVYHKGSVSFTKLSSTEYQSIFSKNRAYFEKKHGVKWAFGDISLGYWNKINRDLDDLNIDHEKNALERILVRKQAFSNALRHSINIENSMTVAHAAQLPNHNKWRRWLGVFYESMVKGNYNDRVAFLNKVARKLKLK